MRHCLLQYENLKSITVRDIPIANLTARDTNICNLDPVVLVGRGSNSIKWFLNKQLFASTVVDTLSTNSPGAYQITVNDGFDFGHSRYIL